MKKPAAVLGNMTAENFIAALQLLQSDTELKKIQRYFKSGAGSYGAGDQFMGVRMGELFQLAKNFIDMPVGEIEKLLEHPVHEVRAGGMSIMDKQGRNNKTPDAQRKALYELYLRRHDRINNWDLVDLAALFVVGRWLYSRPRQPLYKLARSKNMWERRTAIVATGYFIRQGDVDDTFTIAEMLLNDTEDLVQKAAGGWVRAAGGKNAEKLHAFLDTHAATMPRTMLRYAVENIDAADKMYYMKMAKNK